MSQPTPRVVLLAGALLASFGLIQFIIPHHAGVDTKASLAPKRVFQIQLPYPVYALEPHLSQETVFYHYYKHHAGYEQKLLAFPNEIEGQTLETLVTKTVNTSKPHIFNNAAQIFNHNIYWSCMAPPGATGVPSELVNKLASKSFGTFDNLVTMFTNSSINLFGSGWVWLVYNKNSNQLEILQTKDAHNPLSDYGDHMVPLLANDMWEHSYYIDYRNDKAEFLKNWWQVVDWNYVNSVLEEVATPAQKQEVGLQEKEGTQKEEGQQQEKETGTMSSYEQFAKRTPEQEYTRWW